MASLTLCSCEKEIQIELPKQTASLVVEACINDKFPTLNYVFITTTLDYFNPKLDVLGVTGADVYISEGDVIGNDTVYDPQRRFLLADKQFPESPPGIYYNPVLRPQQGKVYKLEIYYQGKTVTGVTHIPNLTRINSSSIRFDGERDGKPRGFVSIYFFDPPEPSYYRMAYTINRDSNLLGFGASERLRLINDEDVNNQYREYNQFQSNTLGDTVNVYLCRMERKEYLFWQSFISARNSDGPFATPVQLQSTVRGAIGSFTGYSIDYKRVIIQ